MNDISYTVYMGYYKAWYTWRGVVRILVYMIGMSNVGWMVHMEGVGKDVSRVRCMRCSVIGTRTLGTGTVV